MIGELTAAGDAAAGALTARAVEPQAGEAGHGAASQLCLNCGTRLIGEHCHRCGQTGRVHRTVGAIGHELAHGVFHFEGKIWRTLPLLAFRPGELTRRYVAGERARFVSPLALFLFSVFLMFAVVANLPTGDAGQGVMDGLTGDAGAERIRAGIADELGQAQAELVRDKRALLRERADPEPDARSITRLEGEIRKGRTTISTFEQAQRVLPPPDGKGAVRFRSSSSWLETKWKHAANNPKLLLYKVKTSAYKYSWALIPLSLPFVWMLFPLRRDVGFYDHAVFATYSLSFMSLFAILVGLAASSGLGGTLLVLAFVLVPPIHIYKQLKGGYRLKRLGALWRTGWMLFFATITSALFLVALVTLGMSD